MTQQTGRPLSRVDSEPLSTAVVRAVADRAGVDPLDLWPPLYEAVDLDALDRLLGPDGRSAVREVVVAYEGYQIHVTGGGEVAVSGPD